jgi:hypothetical protein
MPRSELSFHFREAEFPLADPPERRNALRLKVAEAALIILNNDWTRVTATIQDMSETGARLMTACGTTLPATFMLVIPSENVAVAVRLAWQIGHEVGVQFTGERRPASAIH